MKKRIILLFILLFLLVAGCQEIPKTSFEIDTTLIGNEMKLSEFDLSLIKIKVNQNGNTSTINVNESMLSEEDYQELLVPGKHDITIIYKDQSFNISITLIDDHKTDITYDIDTSLLPSTILVGELDISAIRIKVTIEDNVSYINVTKAMISDEDLAKLKTKGTHTITITYKNFISTVTITLIDNTTIDPLEAFNSSMAYYKNANGKIGNELKLALRTIISKTTHKETYDDLKDDTLLSDTDLTNSNNIILFYSRKSVNGKWDGAATWNREHVWAQSLGWFKTSGAGADLHHLRPEDPTLNSTRGNKKFGDLNHSTANKAKLSAKNGGGFSGCYYQGDYFEPQDCVKGDVARIIFYLMVRYSEADNYSFTRIAQSKELLLKWNAQDPVDEYEIHRNEAVYKIQGNRNPFIDHPETATLIWGTYNVCYNENKITFEIVWYIEKKYTYVNI